MITNKTIYQHAILRSLNKSGSGQTTGTAQGAIASFETNTEKPIVSGIFDIDYNESGVSGMDITRCGKNLFPFSSVSGTRVIEKNVFLPAGTYTVSALVTSSDTDGSTSMVYFYYADGTTTFLRLRRNIRDSKDIVLSKSVTAFRFYAGYNSDQSVGDTFEFSDVQIELGTAPTTYEAYTGDTYPVSFGDTIYGGTFNGVTGILTSTLDSDGTPLETPVTSELTPVEIDTLDGINNIFCDTGDSDISYIVNGASKKDKVLSYLPLIYGRKELL